MSFDRLARHYRWMEFVLAGGVLQRARVHWIDALAERPRMLFVGEGPGRCLGEVLRRFPRAEPTVVDASAAMLATAQRRLRARRLPVDRVTWVHADIRAWTPPAQAFAAIVTPFVLDCFTTEDLPRVVAALARTASADAVWLVADFRVPDRGWRRVRARAVHALMYRFFRTVVRLESSRLTPPDEWLAQSGFRRFGRVCWCGELVHSDLWQRDPGTAVPPPGASPPPR